MTDVFAGAEGLDNVAPQVQNQNPAPSDTNVLVTSNVYLEIVDNPGGAGVDLASVNIDLDGVPAVVAGVAQPGYPTTITPITDGYSFDINPDVDLTFNDTIPVQVDAQDLNLTPNVMPTVNYSFDTEQGDLSPPVLENQTPAPGAIEVAQNTTIQLDVIDPPTTPTFGVDLTSINIQVQGEDAVIAGAVAPGWIGNIQVQGTGYRITLTPPADFDLYELVLVEVQAADLIVANALDTSYSFRITEGLTDVPPELMAIAFDGFVRLSWSIDTGVMVDTWQLVKSEIGFPTTPLEGEIILEGDSQTLDDTEVVNGKRYYYSIFLIRRYEAGLPLYAPYDEDLSSKSAKPRAVVSTTAASAEYTPQRGEFGKKALPVVGGRLSGIFGDRVSGGLRTYDVFRASANSAIRSPGRGSVILVGSSEISDAIGAQFIEIETDNFIFKLDNITVDNRLTVGSQVEAGELVGRSNGGDINFFIFRKPTGSFGLRVVRPSLFVLRVEDREGLG